MHTLNNLVCDLLNLYGCNSPTIPSNAQSVLNLIAPDGYTLPTDRCEFDTINLTYITQPIRSLGISGFGQGSVKDLSSLPCEILVQLPEDTLQSKDLSYLIDYDYWFLNDTYLTCNQSLAISCNESSTNRENSTIYNNDYTLPNSGQIDDPECYLGDECLYPFVQSLYAKDEPQVGGMCKCGLDCRLSLSSTVVKSTTTKLYRFRWFH